MMATINLIYSTSKSTTEKRQVEVILCSYYSTGIVRYYIVVEKIRPSI